MDEPARLKVESETFADGATVPASARYSGMGVGGDNRSPHIRWSGAPAGTKSYVVTMHDPDAPTGTGFYHWIVFNIPFGTNELAENAGEAGGRNLPAGATHGYTDFGAPGYNGAAPPPGHGQHRYQVHVYALDVPALDADTNATGALVRFLTHGHVLAEGMHTGLFGR